MRVIDRPLSAAKRPSQPTLHRLSVDDYLRMHEAGLFGPEPHVELVDGEVYDMATIGSRHASTVTRLNRATMSAVGTMAIVTVQNPLRLGNSSMPEPDLMLLRPRADFYADAHPTAADVLLLIEVADTSARYDREIKLPLYARHGVAEVWIIDLDAREMSVCRAPQGDAYGDVTRTGRPGPTAAAGLPGVVIDLTDLLP